MPARVSRWQSSPRSASSKLNEKLPGEHFNLCSSGRVCSVFSSFSHFSPIRTIYCSRYNVPAQQSGKASVPAARVDPTRSDAHLQHRADGDQDRRHGKSNAHYREYCINVWRSFPPYAVCLWFSIDLQDSGAQKHVEMIAEDAFEKHTSEKEIAAAIRASMDQAYGKYWNVVVRWTCRSVYEPCNNRVNRVRPVLATSLHTLPCAPSPLLVRTPPSSGREALWLGRHARHEAVHSDAVRAPEHSRLEVLITPPAAGGFPGSSWDDCLRAGLSTSIWL